MIDLSIIIVSWNVADLLAACLDSILRDTSNAAGGPQIEIIVVDSASTDHSVALLHEHYPTVRCIEQTENLGFVRCNNIGLAAAQGQYLLLLNPDTEVVDDALTTLVQYLEAHPQVGIVGPRTINLDGSTQSTRRRFPTLAIGFLESTWLQSLARRSLLDRYYVADAADEAIVPVDWVQGSALLARRAVYDQIGGLDPGYIMYSEELDWCHRAKDVGWEVVYLGTARIIHHGGKSSEQVVARRHIHFQTSKLRYFRKFHGPLAAQTLRIFLMATYLWQIGLESAKALLGHKRAMRTARVRQYWQVLRSGLKVT